jgi:protein SCO1
MEMSETMKKHWFKFLITAVVLVVIGVMILQVQGGKEKLPVIKAAPQFTLEGLDGKPMSLNDHDGKVRLVYFFYSNCPDVCLPTNHILSEVQTALEKEKLFGSDAVMFSITFDPERDTQERLKQYSEALRVNPEGWKFLRGGEKEVADIALTYGISAINLNNGIFMHQNVVTVIDREGNIRKIFKATEADVDPKDIVATVKQLTAEAR